MSIELAKYTFTPWIRKGFSSNINEADTLGTSEGEIIERASLPVTVRLNSTLIEKEFSMIGPGDILGINKDMIIRTEPLDWITNFEPNYLAFVEFYDEDFAWRYTPATSTGDKLRPWISLLVLKEKEFKRTERKVPLPSIEVTHSSSFPSNSQTWAWAHAHTNNDFTEGELNDLEQFLRSLNEKFSDSPDDFYCRLMSPRKLEPDTSYYAFVVPTFETGRLIGLEMPTTGIPAQKPSWDEASSDLELPIYHEWYFRTGSNMDFEYLIRQLQPRAIDKKVGVREMDCSKPDFGIVTGTVPSILGLEGALKSPEAESSEFPIKPRQEKDFQKELQQILNLPYVLRQEDNTEDPVVSAPIYGNKHALLDEINIDSEGWVHKLNSDPRNRVPAGFGTRVIQKDQDKFMQKAWQQVQKIIEANKKIVFVRIALAVSRTIVRNSFNLFSSPLLVTIANPILTRVLGSPATLYHQLKNSILETTLSSRTFRKITRPRGKLIRKINLESGKKFDFPKLVHAVNSRQISPAPPLAIPKNLPNAEELSSGILKWKVPGWLKLVMKYYHYLFLALVVASLVLAFMISLTTFGIITGGLVLAYGLLIRPVSNLLRKSNSIDLIKSPKDAVKIIEKTPFRENFELYISDPDDRNIPAEPNHRRITHRDSPEGERFRTAAVNFNKRLEISSEEKVKVPPAESFRIDTAQGKISESIDPVHSYARYLKARVQFPVKNDFAELENIIPAMAYPDFEEPMYEKLRDISVDLLIPNINLVPDNTISLLVTNQPFIESYMVGLNHEMGRELLWREYPTDCRGSYFRQFWDVNGIIGITDDEMDSAELGEKYKDIKPIHTWKRSTELGMHNNRDAEGDKTQIVLMIKGELFKHYPNTVVFAQKAHKKASDLNEKEIKLELTNEEIKNELKFPLYKAEIIPDIKFYGFDLTVEQATGEEKTPGFTDNEGWFFIIQQPPGEPRFGMDISIEEGDENPTWDNLSWEHFTADLSFIDITTTPSLVLPPGEESRRWGASSAQMAYILYQKPVMIAVHAIEMLEGL